MRSLLLRYKTPLIVLICSLYAGLLSYYFLKAQFTYAGILGGFPFVVGGVYLAINNFKILYGIMVFSLPLSLNVKEIGDFGISLPGELVIVFLAGVGLMRIIWDYDKYKDVFSHWLTKVIVLHVVWMLVTVFTSTMTMISLKFFVIRFIYVLVFYVLSVEWLLTLRFKATLVWLYAVAMIVPIVVSIIYHSQFGFTQASCYMVGEPFYNDHTIYAACLAMLIPVFVIEMFRVENITLKLMAFLVFVGLSAAILLSYSRAGWGSLCVALAVGLAIRFGVSFKVGMLSLLLVIVGVVYNGQDIMERVRKNDTQSSEGFLNHASSVSNISTDNSNMERLNRWACAIRMFEDKPFVGFGPGTYSFQYSKFQRSEEMTWVSVRDGSVGGVHSEYLKPLSEMGLVGFVLFMVIAFGTLKVGIDVYQDKTVVVKSRYFLMGALLGYVTYLVHGFVNFFLDTDKSSVLFWGFIAVAVAMDIEKKRLIKKQNS